ncbi:MAG: acyl carrier protein [Bacillota bacterium]|nr:acyl carrier protein [Bacillota bacterium]
MIFEKVTKMIAEKIDCEAGEMTADTKFEDLGIDSLDVAELAMRFEDEFHIDLTVDNSVKTVGDLTALIERTLNK